MINYESFKDKKKDLINKLVCYYEGDQLRYVKRILDGKDGGIGQRHEWKQRGFIPRARNVTKLIVDKSDNLFNQPPRLEIWKEGQITPITDDTFTTIMYKADWLEFFQNVSHYTRLLRATVVLMQKYIKTPTTTRDGVYRFDEQSGDALLFTLLHEGIACVKQDVVGNIVELAYLFDDEDYEYYEDGDEDKQVWFYRRITPDEIVDVKVYDSTEAHEAEEKVVNVEPNLDGIVPAVVFYDTNKPRKGTWLNPPEDLVSLQEFYNLHLTDIEFAIAHQKQKTLFVDTDIEEKTEGGYVNVPHAPKGYTGPGEVYQDIDQMTGSVGHVGGLGEIVKLKRDGSDKSPMVEFKGPETDLRMLDEIANDLVAQVASDWSVNLKAAGQGAASSGFQLVVEEIDNLQLREQRAQSFQASFRRMYEKLQIMYPELTNGDLLIDFAPPSLPVNHKEVEETWSLKISEGRASRVDYFMEVKNLTREEAEAKVAEIVQMEPTES